MSDTREKRSYTFGPVPSRRLGRSLGIDFVPFKTCTYDCVYCQLGRTTHKTAKIKEYIPIEDVLLDVETRLSTIPRPDYITLSGSGEPTLYSKIEELIHRIKNIADIPVAVLTNGSLFWNDEVCRAVSNADLLLPSLDAGDEETFLLVNRPHRDISFSRMIDGLCSLRDRFSGTLWLEVFLIGGTSDTDEDVDKIKGYIDRISPDRVQLNTAVRVPAETWVRAVPRSRLEEIAARIGPHCEVIADYEAMDSFREFESTCDDVLELLKRRPCSIDDISDGLCLHRNESVKYIRQLMDRHLIKMRKQEGKTLYYTSY